MRTEQEIRTKWQMLNDLLLNDSNLDELQSKELKVNSNALEWVLEMRDHL